MRVLRVVLNLGESKMYVLAEYNGFRKNIRLEWKQLIATDLPPPNWRELVEFELFNEYSNRKKGGLPF